MALTHNLLYNAINDFIVFNPVYTTWEYNTPTPLVSTSGIITATWGHCGVVDTLNDALFLLTGFTSIRATDYGCEGGKGGALIQCGEVFDNSNMVRRIDLETNTIKLVETYGAKPDPRGGALAVFNSFDGSVLLYGGCTVSEYNGSVGYVFEDLWELAPGVGTWAGAKCLPTVESEIPRWTDDYHLTHRAQFPEKRYLYLELRDEIPKEEQVYWGRVLIFIDEEWEGDDYGELEVSLWDDPYSHFETFERYEDNYVVAHMWYDKPIRSLNFRYVNSNGYYDGINRVYEVVLDLAQGPKIYDDNINLIETAYNYDNTPQPYSQVSQKMLPPHLYRITHWRCYQNTPCHPDCSLTTSGALPLFPNRYFSMYSDVTSNLFMKAESMKVWVDSPSGVAVYFRAQGFGESTPTTYTGVWNGQSFQANFDTDAKRIQYFWTDIVNSGNRVRWAGLTQLVNYGDPIDFGSDSGLTGWVLLPQHYGRAETIKIFNDNPVENTIANARVLPRYTNNYELDSSIKITADPNLSIWDMGGWYTIDNGVRIPEDYPWSFGTFSGVLVDSQNRLTLSGNTLSGTWTSPILTCENPSSLIPYMYTSNTAWRKGYVHQNYTSVTEVIEACAKDDEPLEVFAVVSTDTSQSYFSGKHKRVVFDSAGNDLYHGQCDEGMCHYRPFTIFSPTIDTIRYQYPIDIHSLNREVAMGRAGYQPCDSWGASPATGWWRARPEGIVTSSGLLTTSGREFEDLPLPSIPFDSGTFSIFMRPMPIYEADYPSNNISTVSGWSWAQVITDGSSLLYAKWGTNILLSVGTSEVIANGGKDFIRGAACIGDYPSTTSGVLGWVYMGVKDELSYFCLYHKILKYPTVPSSRLPFPSYTSTALVNDLQTASHSGDGKTRFWAISDNEISLYELKDFKPHIHPVEGWEGHLEVLCTVTGSQLNASLPLLGLHYGSVDSHANLWVVDSLTHRILKLDYTKAVEGNDPVVYDKVVAGAVGIYAMPHDGGAYVYCTHRLDYGFSDVVFRFNRFNDPTREEFICKVPGVSIPTMDGVYFTGQSPFFTQKIPHPHDPAWGTQATYNWIELPNASPTLPDGQYKKLRIKLKRPTDAPSFDPPRVDKIRIPVPAIVNSIPWQDSREVYVDTKPNTNLIVSGTDNLAVEILVWWPQERIVT